MKVYNRGTIPVVIRKDWRGTLVIQPGKFIEIPDSMAKLVMARHPMTCTEDQFVKVLSERKADKKKAEKGSE